MLIETALIVFLALSTEADEGRNSEICDQEFGASGVRTATGWRSCLAIIPMFSYNKTQGKCQLFKYGGCGGNDNKFHKFEECHAKCEGNTGTVPHMCDTQKCPRLTEKANYCRKPGECCASLCEGEAPANFSTICIGSDGTIYPVGEKMP